jgi:hypothetical protein
MEAIPNVSKRQIQRYTALFLWVVAGVLFFSLAKQYILLTSSDKEFVEYAQSLIHRAAVDRRAAASVRNLLLTKAGELSIPLQDQQLKVTGHGDTILTVISYQAAIKLPLSDTVLCRLQFDHTLNHRPF